MPGDLLDLILIALAAAFAVAGYRQGFIIGVLSFVGFLGGAAVGAIFSPAIARALVSEPDRQAFLAILVVFLAAMIRHARGVAGRGRVRSRVTWRPVAVLDAIGGAVVNVMSVLLIAWLIGSSVVYAPFPPWPGRSTIPRCCAGVDRFIPAGAHVMFSAFRRLLTSGPYTQVFGALGAEGSLTVPPPDPSVVNSAGADAGPAERGQDRGHGARPARAGSRDRVSSSRPTTSSRTPTWWRGAGRARRSSPAAPVPGEGRALRPQRDIAVLYVPGLGAPPLSFAGPAEPGANAIVAGYPMNRRFTAVPARVDAEQSANGPDIYQTPTVTRDIYPVRAVVRPGNSGGPLLAPRQVYGDGLRRRRRRARYRVCADGR